MESLMTAVVFSVNHAAGTLRYWQLYENVRAAILSGQQASLFGREEIAAGAR